MNDLSRIKAWLEADRQIGKSAPVEQGGTTIWWSVGVQRWQGLYKLYIDKFDTAERIDYDAESEEIIPVTDLNTLYNLIKTKSPFKIEELAPLKGQKIFNPRF